MPARSSRFPGLKLSVLVFAACCLNLAAPAQTPAATGARTLVIDGLGKGVGPLDGPWQFHLGDDPAWASPGYDDSHWEQLTSDKTWGAQSHPSYTGFAWYRRTIHITPAPGADANVALLIPTIDDAYELYWNGVKVGQLGTLPPHPVFYEGIPNQTYGLGPIRSGVLAVRVWKFALASNDPDNLGGFEAPPLVGSPSAIAAEKGNRDFKWLRSRQFTFGLTSLYALVALLSFLAWLRDRDQWLLFWMSLYALMLTMDVVLIGLRLPYPFAIAQFATQIAIAIREASGWFLLIWLLQLHQHPRLVYYIKLAAILGITSAAIDGCLSFLYPDFISAVQMQIADAITTFPSVAFEGIPVVLVAYAIFKRARLDSTRWLVAILAFLNATVYWVENATVQGVRYTHWTLSDKITATLFTVNGNNFNLPTILRTLLFLSIVYAVIRYTIDNRRRQNAMEQEFQNARELQQVLVPENLPALPGFNLTSAYRPAQEVGGDFFQIIPLEEGSTLIVLGDVSGKGLKAAMAVSMIVGAVRTLVETTSRPAEILAGLNRRLFGRLQGGFATAVALRLDGDGTCTIACAGHPAPYVNDQELVFPGTLPLGVLPKAEFEETKFQMGERDQLALYTDGLLEARSQNGDLYSFARLKTLFASRPTAEQAAEAAVNFGQDDDITVLTLTRIAISA
ncbi:MAG TPA: SpoIIE family protein phosphatase [Terracidiphilus sp.]|nr:SpoIIE family protein phosphatase [Terracidiphilus sp.]